MHPEVDDAAVFGIPNEDFGQEVKAVIQPGVWPDDEAAFQDAIIAYCRAHLSRIKVPRSVDLSPELPRQPNGKLYQTALRAAYLKESQSCTARPQARPSSPNMRRERKSDVKGKRV